MKRLLPLLFLGIAASVFSQTKASETSDIRDYLANLEIEVGYARATMIPLIWLDFSAIPTLFSEDEETKPFFVPQGNAWGSMGTYLFQFWNADPNEMNLPGIDLTVRYYNFDDINYFRLILSPFFAADQRAFYIRGETGVDYEAAKPWDGFRTVGTIYAFGNMLGFESSELLMRFFDNYGGGAPPVEATHNGLGMVSAGTGFRGTMQFGYLHDWSLSFKFYFELGAFLPFNLTYGTGMDLGFDLKIVDHLYLYLDARLMKAAWEPAGLNVGVRYRFQGVAGLLESWDTQEPETEDEVLAEDSQEPLAEEPLPEPVPETNPRPGNKKKP